MVSSRELSILRRIERARRRNPDALRRELRKAPVNLLQHTKDPIRDKQIKIATEESDLRTRAANSRARRSRARREAEDRRTSRDKRRISSSGIIAVTRSLEGGGTVTVTARGRVTQTDSKGRRESQFFTSDREAKSFIEKESKNISAIRRSIATLRSEEQKKEVKALMSDRKIDFRALPSSILLSRVGKILQKKQIPKSTVRAVKKKKGLAGARQKLTELTGKERLKAERTRGVPERVLRGTLVLGILGAARGTLGVVETIRHPIRTARTQIAALKQPVQTIKALGHEFSVDPVGTVAEFWIYSRALNLAARSVKRSPIGRFVQEELFIAAQPTVIRGPVRKIIKAAKVQEKINPTKIKSIKKVDFFDVKSLTKVEAKALAKTLRETDSVVFGSKAARVLSKSKTPIPKDVDIATSNIGDFTKKFVSNLPRNARVNLVRKGQKVIRKSTKEPLFDIKPLNRLIPDRSIITRRGFLPVAGFVDVLEAPKGSILPKLVKRRRTGVLTVPTQKIEKVKGIRLVGFGEQTTRKALGTLQFLIEKDVRRAKDPSGLLISLEVQLAELIKNKPKSKILKLRFNRRVKTLKAAIKLLKSKSFAKALEKKVPGIAKQFPIVSKIDAKKLRKVSVAKVAKAVKEQLRKRLEKKVKIKKVARKKIPKKKPSKLPRKKVPSRLPRRKKPSKLPSRLAKRRKRSRLPSRVPRRKPSKLPSKIPRKKPSKLPRASRLAVSKLPSRLPRPSKVPRPSRVPKGKPSKVPAARRRAKFLKLPTAKARRVAAKLDLDRRKSLNELAGKEIKKRKFIYIPDLYSRIFNIKANLAEKRKLLQKGGIFSGVFIRKLTGKGR